MNKELFKTADLGLAAALETSGFLIIDLDGTNPKRVWFKFVDTPELKDHVLAYQAGGLTVRASDYYHKLRQLKARIYGVDKHNTAQ